MSRRAVERLDVDAVRNEREFRSVDTRNLAPLVNGRVLRIRVRIEGRVGDLDGLLGWLGCEDAHVQYGEHAGRPSSWVGRRARG
jgi:hypothetical protein